MIIECQACRTRFRLDESKITGKGARIRCRRCSEAIIVMKSDIPPPAVSPPAGKELFDLRAVLQEPEKKIPVPPRNEVDTAFNGILDQDRETGRIPPPVVEEPAFPTALEQEASTQELVEPLAAAEPVSRGDIATAFDTPPYEDREREVFAQEPADTLLSHEEVDTALESPRFSVVGSEAPAVDEPAFPTAPEQETSTAEPVEPLAAAEPVSRGDISTAFDTPLYEDREKETPAQEPADTPLPHDETDQAFESPLFSEGESEPPAMDEPPPLPIDKDLVDLRAIFGEPEEKTADPLQGEAYQTFESPLFSEGESEPSVREEPEFQTALEQEALTEEPVEPQAADETAPQDDIATQFDTLLYEDRERETPAQELAGTPLPHEETDQAFESPLFSEGESEPPAVDEPASPMTLDQEALTREPVEPPTADETAPRDDIATAFDTPLYEDREQETLAQEPADTSLPRDETDQAFESPLFSEGESEPPVVEEPASPTAPERFPDTPFSLELEKEEEITFLPETGDIPIRGLRELADQEEPTSPPPMERGREQIHESEEFLKLDTVLPDFLRKEGAAAESSGRFDISEQLTIDPIGTPDEDKASFPPTPDHPLPTEETSSSRADAMHEEMAELAESSPVEETSVPEPSSAAVPPPIPLEIGKGQATHPRPPVPSGKPSIALLLILFVTVAGGGAYLAFTKTGQDTLRTLVPGMESLWLGGKESVRPYHVGNLIGYYETSEKAGKMFIIKGVATNQGQSKKSGIRIRAELLDSNHQTIAEKTVYAGNIVAGLRFADQEKIEAAMSNRFGDRLSNLDVEPGKSVPFMVAFFAPPEGIEEYRLEALDGD